MFAKVQLPIGLKSIVLQEKYIVMSIYLSVVQGIGDHICSCMSVRHVPSYFYNVMVLSVKLYFHWFFAICCIVLLLYPCSRSDEHYRLQICILQFHAKIIRFIDIMYKIYNNHYLYICILFYVKSDSDHPLYRKSGQLWPKPIGPRQLRPILDNNSYYLRNVSWNNQVSQNLSSFRNLLLICKLTCMPWFPLVHWTHM